MVGWVRARPESSIGSARGPRAGREHASPCSRRIVLADGDVAVASPTRRGLAGLGRRRSRSSSPRTAAPGMPERLGLAIDGGSAMATRSATAGIAAPRGGPGVRSSVATGQGRDRTPSWPSRARSTAAPTASSIVGALGGPRLDHALANVGAPGHARARRRRRPSRRRRRPRPAAVARRPDGRRSPSDAHGRIGDLVSLLPVGGDATA